MKVGLLLIILALLSACANVTTQQPDSLRLSAFPICYNSNCKNRVSIHISEQEWKPIVALFDKQQTSPHQERLAIRQAIAMLEQVTGAHTPTHNDKKRNSNAFDEQGRMDCVDESTNTTNYLRLLSQHGYLHWHQVESRAFRSHFFIDQHFTARISENGSKQLYAVDSWHRDNGEPPYIQPYTAWLLKLAYSKHENPD